MFIRDPMIASSFGTMRQSCEMTRHCKLICPSRQNLLDFSDDRFGHRAFSSPNRLRVNSDLLRRINLIWVVGSPRTNISLSGKQKLCSVHAVPPRQEGRTRRHERGAGCGGRSGDARRAALVADGEVVWSWRPDAGAKFSREAIPAKVTGANEPGPRGEHEISC
jgi:hypothetical protein